MHTTIEDNKKARKQTVQGLLEHGVDYGTYIKRAPKDDPLNAPMTHAEWNKVKEELEAQSRAEDAKEKLKEEAGDAGLPEKKKEPGKAKEKAKAEPVKKPDTKQDEKGLRPRKNVTQDVIDKLFMKDGETEYIQGLERNRSISDAEFMRRALINATPELRRRIKDMDAKEFREFYEALWLETQP